MTFDRDRSALPTAEHPYGIAVCGTPIIPNMIVFTNEMRCGKVVPGSNAKHSPGWFDVRYRDGSGAMQDPQRVSTKWRTYEGDIEDAEDRYNHHDFHTSLIDGTKKCRVCGTIGGDDDLCHPDCAYCGKPKPPEEWATEPWTWPGRGLVVNCKGCAGIVRCEECGTEYDAAESGPTDCEDHNPALA